MTMVNLREVDRCESIGEKDKRTMPIYRFLPQLSLMYTSALTRAVTPVVVVWICKMQFRQNNNNNQIVYYESRNSQYDQQTLLKDKKRQAV